MTPDFSEEERMHLENYLGLSQDLNKVQKYFRSKDFDEVERLLRKSLNRVEEVRDQ